MISDIDLKNIDFFTFDGLTTDAYICDIYDGDTLTCVFNFNNKYQKFKIRMIGYDAPELKPSKTLDKDVRNKTMTVAKQAKKFLEDKLLHKWVILECGEFDKYGRILGKIKINKIVKTYINEDIIDAGLAIPYFGGTKE